jgi:diphosphomevalonate decarboxylase
MNTNDFISASLKCEKNSGIVRWSAPSNIALVKYWGKKEVQIPTNPSISFTLSECKTRTTVSFEPNTQNNKPYSFEFIFEGKPKTSFHPKLDKYFQTILPYCSFLKNYHLKISSENTFPHSSGIASSASAMAALSACIVSIEKLNNPSLSDSFFYIKASFLARLGSGSACRSIQNSIVVWGETPSINKSSNLYGVEVPHINSVFLDYNDTVLLVDKGEKIVSSSLGHRLMNGHPYAQARFKQAHENCSKLIPVLEKGELELFIELIEQEALTLHAMMMTSSPSYILMKPNTLKIIETIRNFRTETKIPICFTLDAGANVHVLYPNENQPKVREFIANELVNYCEKQQYIHDKVGTGAKML